MAKTPLKALMGTYSMMWDGYTAMHDRLRDLQDALKGEYTPAETNAGEDRPKAKVLNFRNE